MNDFPGLVDSHFHLLSLEARGLDPRLLVAEFFEAGGRWALDVAVDAQGWDRRLAWGADEPRVWYTAGIHPSEAWTPRRCGPYCNVIVSLTAGQIWLLASSYCT